MLSRESSGERGDRFFVQSNLFSSFDGLDVFGEGELVVDWAASEQESVVDSVVDSLPAVAT